MNKDQERINFKNGLLEARRMALEGKYVEAEKIVKNLQKSYDKRTDIGFYLCELFLGEIQLLKGNIENAKKIIESCSLSTRHFALSPLARTLLKMANNYDSTAYRHAIEKWLEDVLDSV